MPSDAAGELDGDESIALDAVFGPDVEVGDVDAAMGGGNMCDAGRFVIMGIREVTADVFEAASANDREENDGLIVIRPRNKEM